MAKLSKIERRMRQKKRREKGLWKRSLPKQRNPHLINESYLDRKGVTELELVLLYYMPKKGIPLDLRGGKLFEIVRAYVNEIPAERASKDLGIYVREMRSLYSTLDQMVAGRYGSIVHLKNLLKDRKRD